ncbi:MAG: thioesterase family protein [Pseudomonadota bacterium]
MDDASIVFSQQMSVRWADLDPNAHVRHSVYYDWAATVRIAFLESEGFGLVWMGANSIGPVLFREEARFLRELRLGDQVAVDVRVAATSADGRKWRIRHSLSRGAEEVARVEVDGAWLDLRRRKIVVPPADLIHAFSRFPRTEDFAHLPSSVPR